MASFALAGSRLSGVSAVRRTRTVGGPSPLCKVARRTRLVVRAETSQESSVDVDKLVKDLQEKWDKVENKTSVAAYAAGSIVSIWLSATLVGAINSVPLLPKLMELIGLGYSAWFVYRYLLFKSSREELVKDIEEIKKKVTGTE